MTKTLHHFVSITLVFFLFSAPLKANELFANELFIDKHELMVGDVILISLNCMQCRYIESETGESYSHSGIVIATRPELIVAQALGSVHQTSLQNFLKPITPKSKISIMRAKELMTFNLSKLLVNNYHAQFEGLPFDGQYLWENVDQWGREKIYCSELILKLLNTVLSKKIEPEILIYQKHFDYWKKVFNGNVPQNEWGNSPASLFRDRENFEYIGQLID